MQAFVRWDHHRQALVDDAGTVITNAQDAKARRYVEAGLVKRVSVTESDAGWGEPSWTREVYELDPVPGCRAQNTVTVTTHRDATTTITGVAFACRCQFYVQKRRACSHILAVHRHRTRIEAGDDERCGKHGSTIHSNALHCNCGAIKGPIRARAGTDANSADPTRALEAIAESVADVSSGGRKA